MKRFTFYDLYWKLIKNESDQTAGGFIRNACEYMFDGKQLSEPTDDKEAFIWDTAEEFLSKTKALESEEKTPKTFNKKMAHFSFENNYYKAIKLMSDEECGAYIKALCGYMFDGVEPKKLKPPVDSYFEIAKTGLELSKVRISSGRKDGQTERVLIGDEAIKRKTNKPYLMTYEEFMRLHPKMVKDLYSSREYLLKGVDWNVLSIGLEKCEKYKNSTSLFEILTHRKEIESKAYEY